MSGRFAGERAVVVGAGVAGAAAARVLAAEGADVRVSELRDAADVATADDLAASASSCSPAATIPRTWRVRR